MFSRLFLYSFVYSLRFIYRAWKKRKGQTKGKGECSSAALTSPPYPMGVPLDSFHEYKTATPLHTVWKALPFLHS